MKITFLFCLATCWWWMGCKPAVSDMVIETVDTAYINRLPIAADTIFAAALTPDAVTLGAANAVTYQLGGGQKILTLSFDAQSRVVLMVEKRYQTTIDSAAFHPNGQRLFQLGFNADGLADGPARFFYSDGRISADGRYTNGLKTGIWRQFETNGRLKETHEFDRYGKQQR